MTSSSSSNCTVKRAAARNPFPFFTFFSPKMSPIREFASRLAMDNANASKILQEIDQAFWPEAMSRQNVNKIIRSVKAGQDTKDRRGENTPRRTRTPEAISIVAALVEEDRRITMD